MQAWNGLKGTADIEQYVNVLDQIQPSDIPKGTFVMDFVEFFNTIAIPHHTNISFVAQVI